MRRLGLVGPLHRRDVAFLLHALDELVDQLVELTGCRHLVDLALRVFVEELAGLEDAAQGFAQIVEVVVHVAEAGVGIAITGVEEIVGERLEQTFEVHLGGQVAGVFGVANALHGNLGNLGIQFSQVSKSRPGAPMFVLTKTERNADPSFHSG